MWVHFLGGEVPLEEEMATHSMFFLGNPVEKGAWQAAVHRVTKSQTRLRRGAQRSNRVCVTGSFRISHDD